MFFKPAVLIAISCALSGFAQTNGQAVKRVTVSAEEQMKRLRSRVEPAYPVNVLLTGVRGASTNTSLYFAETENCHLDVFITATGEVTSPRLFDGDTNICRGAEEAVQKWKFDPAVVSGQPVIVITKLTVPMRFSVIDPNGKTFDMDDIIEMYGRQLKMFYNTNPNQTSAHRPLFFRDRSGRRYIAGFQQGTDLGNRMGNHEDFVVMAVDLEGFQSRVAASHYFDLSSGDARDAVAASLEKTDPGVWLAFSAYRWNGFNNLNRVLDWLQMAQALSELHY